MIRNITVQSALKRLRLHRVQPECAAIAALANSSLNGFASADFGLKAPRFCTLVTPCASKIYNSKTGES